MGRLLPGVLQNPCALIFNVLQFLGAGCVVGWTLSLSKQLPSLLLPPFLSSSLQHRESSLNNNKNDDNNNVCQTSLTMNPPDNLEAEAGKAPESSWPFHICQVFFFSINMHLPTITLGPEFCIFFLLLGDDQILPREELQASV